MVSLADLLLVPFPSISHVRTSSRFTPIHIELINSTGATYLLPIAAMSGAGQVGAALALWVRCRHNQPLRNTLKGALPVGFLGIGEPLIYGVTLPLGRPFHCMSWWRYWRCCYWRNWSYRR